MLNPFWVLRAQFWAHHILVLVVEVEVGLGQHAILLNDLIEDVNIERQTLWTLKLLDKFAADRASHTVLVVQLVNAVSAQSVTTVNQDSRDALTHVILEAAELANVKAPRLIVQIHDICVHLCN